MSKKPQKARNRVKKVSKSVFGHFFDTPSGETQEDLFETFWGFRGSGVWRLLYMAVSIVILAYIRARQKGDSEREKPDPERTFSQIFADFRLAL